MNPAFFNEGRVLFVRGRLMRSAIDMRSCLCFGRKQCISPAVVLLSLSPEVLLDTVCSVVVQASTGATEDWVAAKNHPPIARFMVSPDPARRAGVLLSRTQPVR